MNICNNHKFELPIKIELYEDRRSAGVSTQAVEKKKPEKNSGLNGNRTHDLCDTGAALSPTELSSQLGAGQLRVRIYPVDEK